MDNNEGFVAPAVAYCQAELHEEFTMAISALDDAKDSFKSLTKLVPELRNLSSPSADQHANQNSTQPFQVCKHSNGYSICNSWEIWLLVNNFICLERKGKLVQLKVFQQHVETLKVMKVLLYKK